MLELIICRWNFSGLFCFNSGWSTAKEGASSGRFWPRPQKTRDRSFVTEHWYISRTTSRYLSEAHCKAFSCATMNAFFLLKHAWLFWFLAVLVKWTLLFECLPYHSHLPAHGILSTCHCQKHLFHLFKKFLWTKCRLVLHTSSDFFSDGLFYLLSHLSDDPQNIINAVFF